MTGDELKANLIALYGEDDWRNKAVADIGFHRATMDRQIQKSEIDPVLARCVTALLDVQRRIRWNTEAQKRRRARA